MIVKVCGITNAEDAAAAIERAPTRSASISIRRSPRYIAPEQRRKFHGAGAAPRGRICQRIPRAHRRNRAHRRARYGAAPRQRIADYPAHIAIWKARHVTAAFNFSRSPRRTPRHAARWTRRRTYGGAGRTFDWTLARAAAVRSHLAGGLDAPTSPKRSRSRAPGASTPVRGSKPRREKGPCQNAAIHSSRAAKRRSACMTPQPDSAGHFGPYGGRFVPEVLMAPAGRTGTGLPEAARRPGFPGRTGRPAAQLRRPSDAALLRQAAQRNAGGASIWLKREDLLHTGAHKINNASDRRCWPGAWASAASSPRPAPGQHGVATATVCALLGLDCVVYMGEEDMRRQRLNVFRMRLLGAKVVASPPAAVP